MLFKREPAVILAAIQAAIALVLAFGVELSNVQVGCILAFSAAVIGLVTRSQVRPATTS